MEKNNGAHADGNAYLFHGGLRKGRRRYLREGLVAQFEIVQSDLEMGAEGLTETLTSLTEAERETYKESQDTFTVAAVEAWEDVADEVGALEEIKSVTSENTEENYTAVVLAECRKKMWSLLTLMIRRQVRQPVLR